MTPSKVTMVVLNLLLSALLLYFVTRNPLGFEHTGLGTIIYAAVLMGIANAIFIFKIPKAQMKEIKQKGLESEIRKKRQEIQEFEEKLSKID